jgi:hypothetical protein
MRHSKQFFLVKNDFVLGKSIKGFLNIKFEYFTLYYCSTLATKSLSDGSIFLGDLFSDIKKETTITPKEYLNEVADIGGRWVYISDEYLFTDFLASKAVFFNITKTVLSSSFGILRELGLIEQKSLTPRHKYKYSLPPATEYPTIKQMLPGSFFIFDQQAIKSHGIDYFNIKADSDEALIEKMSELMISYSKNSYAKLKEKGFYHALTGGVDSRLTLSSYLAAKCEHSSFTHKKPYLYMTKSDEVIPHLLSKKYNFSHKFTNAIDFKFTTKDYLEHLGRDADFQVGSNLYYYTKGQMEMLKGSYFIDNYYETGARWMVGKGVVGRASMLAYDDFVSDGYITNKEDFLVLKEHILSLSGNNIDYKDVLYFIKNFCTVGHLFYEMDYYMRPIVNINNRTFFSMMLSTTTDFRSEQKMLIRLIEKNKPDLIDFKINAKDSIFKKILFKLFTRYFS